MTAPGNAIAEGAEQAVATAAPAAPALTRIVFTVGGTPMAKGDHTIGMANGGRPFLREKNAGQKEKWRKFVAALAHRATGGAPPLEQALRVTLEVFRVRPRSHFGTGRNARILKAGKPTLPTSKPDLDKLARSLGDALNGVVWRDDALISTWVVTRRWAEQEGIRVTIEADKTEVLD